MYVLSSAGKVAAALYVLCVLSWKVVEETCLKYKLDLRMVDWWTRRCLLCPCSVVLCCY